MTRHITNKGVDKFAEFIHDYRFSPHLFASSIANENRYVNQQFFEVIVCYLQTLSMQYARGIDYLGIQDLSSMAYKMYSTYLESGGTGEIPVSLDLNIFDMDNP
jgi:hypothetical protein